MMDDTRWMDRSRLIDKLDIEIFFELNSTFYLGDPNNSKQLNDKAYREPFALPAFPRAIELSASTAEVSGHELLLADYYQRLLERASTLNKGFGDISLYFWMKMNLWNEAENVWIAFPWYDHLSEMSDVIEWLDTASETHGFCDVDQGWHMDGCLIGEHIHLREVDPDTRQERVNVAVPRSALADAARQVERRAVGIIAVLTEALGTDYWTCYQGGTTVGTVIPQLEPGSILNGASIVQRFKTYLTHWFRR
jgi:hypothetical protein